MAVMSIKDYQDLYKEHVGTTFSSKDFIEQFDKAFRISSKKKKNKAEELAKSYEEALERAKEVLGKDSGSFNSVLENLTKYFDEKDNKDTDQTKIQKETAEEISELSKKVKKLKTNSEDLEKKLKEKGTDKSLGFFKRRKELKQLEKDLKKSKKIFLLCVSERKEAKAQALTEGVASKSTTMNLIYHEKNKQGIVGFLMQAKETLSKIEKEKDKNGKIKGYRDLSVKEYDNLIKALTSSTKREFLSSCYDFEKIRENIYNSMKSKRRKSNDENDISDIILNVRNEILKFVENTTIPTLKNITEHPEKVKELSIKYNSDVEKEKKAWLDYFPLGVRTSAKNFIEVCLGNASLGMNSISQRIQKTTKEYSKAVKALLNGSFILSTSTIAVSTTSGTASMALLPVVALGITMISSAIKNLANAKNDMNTDEDVVGEIEKNITEDNKLRQQGLIEELQAKMLLKKPLPTPKPSKAKSTTEVAPEPNFDGKTLTLSSNFEFEIIKKNPDKFNTATTIILEHIKIIPSGAFRGWKNLQLVQGSVLEVGEHAFEGCVQLRKVDLSLTKGIAKCAFRDCVKLEIVNIPETVRIGEVAFSDCIELKKLDLSKVTLIHEAAFMNCIKLTEVNLPKGKLIGESAFKNCLDLIKVEAPAAEKIECLAFENCKRLYHIPLFPSNCEIDPTAFNGSGVVFNEKETTPQPAAVDEKKSERRRAIPIIGRAIIITNHAVRSVCNLLNPAIKPGYYSAQKAKRVIESCSLEGISKKIPDYDIMEEILKSTKLVIEQAAEITEKLSESNSLEEIKDRIGSAKELYDCTIKTEKLVSVNTDDVTKEVLNNISSTISLDLSIELDALLWEIPEPSKSLPNTPSTLPKPLPNTPSTPLKPLPHNPSNPPKPLPHTPSNPSKPLPHTPLTTPSKPLPQKPSVSSQSEKSTSDTDSDEDEGSDQGSRDKAISIIKNAVSQATSSTQKICRLLKSDTQSIDVKSVVIRAIDNSLNSELGKLKNKNISDFEIMKNILESTQSIVNISLEIVKKIRNGTSYSAQSTKSIEDAIDTINTSLDNSSENIDKEVLNKVSMSLTFSIKTILSLISYKMKAPEEDTELKKSRDELEKITLLTKKMAQETSIDILKKASETASKLITEYESVLDIEKPNQTQLNQCAILAYANAILIRLKFMFAKKNYDFACKQIEILTDEKRISTVTEAKRNIERDLSVFESVIQTTLDSVPSLLESDKKAEINSLVNSLKKVVGSTCDKLINSIESQVVIILREVAKEKYAKNKNLKVEDLAKLISNEYLLNTLDEYKRLGVEDSAKLIGIEYLLNALGEYKRLGLDEKALTSKGLSKGLTFPKNVSK